MDTTPQPPDVQFGPAARGVGESEGPLAAEAGVLLRVANDIDVILMGPSDSSSRFREQMFATKQRSLRPRRTKEPQPPNSALTCGNAKQIASFALRARRGRPAVAVELSGEEREKLQAVGAAAEVRAGAGAAVPDRAGRGRGPRQQ